MNRVLIADDHQLLRQALRRALEDAGFEVVGEAADGEEAARLAAQLLPEIVVMDVTMPVLDGVAATREVVAAVPDARVVMLTMHGESSLIAECLDAGACAFLTKDTSMHDVVETVRQTADGEILLSPEIARGTLRELGGGDGPPLTKREVEVLQLVAEGKANKQTAAELGISIKTVEKHRQQLMRKLDIHDTAGLTRYAIAAGIVESSVQLTIE